MESAPPSSLETKSSLSPSSASPPDTRTDPSVLASLIRSLELDVPSVPPSEPKTPPWPANVIPPEIFAQVASYLPRETVKALRLVCKEFDAKISPILVRTVVVPFKSELFGQLGARKQTRTVKTHDGKVKESKRPGVERGINGTAQPKNNGLRIFKDFGHHIQRFGMSFEIDEESLLRAPTKKHTKTILAFWGSYEWPVQYYPRFKHCQGLEAAADETGSMTYAFSNLSKVNELGLTIDNGLGWLAGPDISWRRKICKSKPDIFRRYHQGLNIDEEMQKEDWEELLRRVWYLNSEDEKYRVLKKLRNLKQIPDLLPPVPSSARSSSDVSREKLLGGLGNIAADEVFSAKLNLSWPSWPPRDDLSADESEPPIDYLNTNNGYEDSFDGSTDSEPYVYKPNEENDSYWNPVKKAVPGHITPNKLTQGQKEWLLETDWAQRAFLSSYTLAVIDNGPALRNVHSLLIARMPSKYLDMLRRHDFWSTLENLKRLSIFVTPDWHEIVRKGEDNIYMKRLLPSSSITRFYNLLSEFISPLVRVQRLRIGWSDGGEYAPGLFARNQHVMPAPVVPEAIHMHPDLSAKASGDSKSLQEEETAIAHLLELPHVGHLTLSNCWISFKTLMNLTKNLRAQKLREIWLDSVSLSTLNPISKNPPTGLPNPQAQEQPHNAGSGDSSTPSPSSPIEPDSSPLYWTAEHASREGSWVEYIDRFTPLQTLAQLRHEAGYTLRPPPPPTMNDRLDVMHFYSCGYAKLNVRNQNPGPPPGPGLTDRRAQNIQKFIQERQNAIAPAMVKTTDRFLGTIIPYLRYGELEVLEDAFGLREGWPLDIRQSRFEALWDGQGIGGTGRFSGWHEKDDDD